MKLALYCIRWFIGVWVALWICLPLGLLGLAGRILGQAADVLAGCVDSFVGEYHA